MSRLDAWMCANWVFYFLSVYLRYSGRGLDFVDFKATAERPKPTYCDWRSGNIKACKSGLRWILDLQRFRYMTQPAHYTMREPRLTSVTTWCNWMRSCAVFFRAETFVFIWQESKEKTHPDEWSKHFDQFLTLHPTADFIIRHLS